MPSGPSTRLGEAADTWRGRERDDAIAFTNAGNESSSELHAHVWTVLLQHLNINESLTLPTRRGPGETAARASPLSGESGETGQGLMQ